MAGERMVSQEEKGSFIAYAYNAGIRNLAASQLNRVEECYTFADDVLSYKGISSAPKQLRDELALTYLRLHVQQGQEIEKVGDAAAAAISGGQLDAAMIPEMQPYLIAAREYLQKRAGIAPGPSEQEKQTRAAATDLRFGTTKFRTLEGKRIDVYEVDAGARPAEAKLSKGREYPAGEWNAEQGRVAYRQRSSAFHALVDDRRSVLAGMIFVERSEERAGGKDPSLSQKAMGDYNRAGGSVRIQGNLPTPDAWRTTVLINMRDEMGRIWGSESRSLENKLSACEEKYRSYVADIVEFSSPSFQKDVTRWEGVGGIRLDPEGRMADRRVLENRWGVSLDWMLYIGDNYTTTMRTKFDRSLNRIFGMHDEEKQKSDMLCRAWRNEFSKFLGWHADSLEFLEKAHEDLVGLAKSHSSFYDPMYQTCREVLRQADIHLMKILKGLNDDVVAQDRLQMLFEDTDGLYRMGGRALTARGVNRIFGRTDEVAAENIKRANAWKEDFLARLEPYRSSDLVLGAAEKALEQLARRHKNELDPMHNAIRDAQSEVNAALAPKQPHIPMRSMKPLGIVD